jgi:hypothetical protein
VTDDSDAFARTCCATLTHLDLAHTDWGSCATYLETEVGEQPAAETDIPTDLAVIVVGGIFSHCFEAKRIFAFQEARDHLSSRTHRLKTNLIIVSGVATPEANAAAIDKYLQDNGGARLLDLGREATIFGFKRAARKSGLADCQITDEGGISSLSRAN